MKYLAFSSFFLALEYGTAFILPSTTRSAYFRSPSAVTTSLQSSATEELTPGIEAINSMNSDIEPLLSELREQEYFRLYSVDMLGSCEYMPQELFECYSETCEIYPIDEEEVPERVAAVDMAEHEFELDGWARWDMPSEDYYDITQFPEEFTGYDGSEVWTFIHNRIAFHDDSITDEYNADNWKADFNKAVSGLHSCISAQIVRGIEKKIAQGEDFDEDCEWTDPKVEFERRLSENGETPQALENLFFGYMLLLSAVRVAKDRLVEDCDSGKMDDGATEALRNVLTSPLLDEPNIKVASRKLHDHAVRDEESVNALWEARLRTREMFRIMNCVQCNKCRLHGKIGAMGLSTAFQLLLGRTGEGGDVKRVHRVELAALMTTLSKFSTAIKFCKKMQSS
uniref:Endoplasmic reticulum oxidoreductin 1 n=1 Tax=Chaetoceros debilis TaxID=122233 RepID=A0A7S3PVZ4_9STRA|mmetsp:Transcript_6662/g.9783  ORF Transcript_6662/g.9783 Transcript_6662/m.9783 type:complete len:397 (+) Transcript_6662:100-1290(+)